MGTQIELITGLEESDSSFAAYEIAGRQLLTDAWTKVLTSYAVGHPVTLTMESQAQTVIEMRNVPITYAGKGRIGNAWRDVECRRTDDGYYLLVAGVGAYWIAEDGNRIELAKADPTAAKELLHETALGAPLVLALALQGVFCLHVSAVRGGNTLAAFSGESGQGKSTLARFLGFDSGPGWQRIIDDTLPVTINEVRELEALPHFPQLKLAGEHQPVNLVPAHMPLDVLYNLVDESRASDKTVRIDELTRQMATLALVRHTVGARLFDQQLLQRHLSFCVELSTSLPVRRLSYKRGLEYLPDIRAALAADLGLQS